MDLHDRDNWEYFGWLWNFFIFSTSVVTQRTKHTSSNSKLSQKLWGLKKVFFTHNYSKSRG